MTGPGEWGPDFRMLVEEGKVGEFWAALGGAAATTAAPATFPMAQKFWSPPMDWAAHGVDLDMRRVLHGEQEFVYPNGPMRIGQALTGRHRIADDYTKQGRQGGTMRFIVRETEFRDADSGEVVCIARTTTIQTSEALGGPS